MKILDGRASSAAQRVAVTDAVSMIRRCGVRPRLDVVLVGNDPASESYVSGKQKAAQSCGIESRLHRLPASVPFPKLIALIDRLNRARFVHGILLQLPLPDGLDEDAAIYRISPLKDVDGLHPENLGLLAAGRRRFVSCTPKGIVHLLDYHGIGIDGREVVVVGRSRLVGRPLALLLIQRHATVTVCHTRTRRLASVTRRADILVVAAGRKHIITARHVRPGAVVVDVGIHVTTVGGKKKFAGDVSPSVARVAGALSPVPCGVGPETVAQLLVNTALAAAQTLSPRHARSFRRTHLQRL